MGDDVANEPVLAPGRLVPAREGQPVYEGFERRRFGLNHVEDFLRLHGWLPLGS